MNHRNLSKNVFKLISWIFFLFGLPNDKGVFMTEKPKTRGNSKSNFPNQKVISHSTYPFIPFTSNPLFLSPPQSSCQPATSSGAAMAASWQETAPSVSVLTALRSARTERAAEVKILQRWWGPSCHGALLAFYSVVLTPISPFALGQTSFSWISRRCWVYENHLSAGRASCTVHYSTLLTHAPTHTHMHILYTEYTVSLCLFLFFMHLHTTGLVCDS